MCISRRNNHIYIYMPELTVIFLNVESNIYFLFIVFAALAQNRLFGRVFEKTPKMVSYVSV